MLNQIHVLLTYTCNYECDHCFLFCGPGAEGTFTLNQISRLVDEADKMGTIEWFYFEGGEPTLFFPLLIQSIKLVKNRGYKVGIVTNGYWATSPDNAQLYVKELKEIGIEEILVSNDLYHYSDIRENFAVYAIDAAKAIGLSSAPLSINPPYIRDDSETYEKAEPIIGGGVMFRGRAAEALTEGLPTVDGSNFTECPFEDLKSPKRVHIDSYGNVQICQGINIGNCWDSNLSELMKEYKPENHPICGPLYTGGPIQLAKGLQFEKRNGFVDPCHLCYSVRKANIGKFPEFLTPEIAYGK